VAFIRDHHVERVVRDPRWRVVLFALFLTVPYRGRIEVFQVDGHPLNRADVHERVLLLRAFQIVAGKHLRIELGAFVEIGLMKPLAVDLVDLVELQIRLGIERRERPDGLRSQRAAVDEKQDPFART
jgi:hypothetical protein